MFLLFTFFELSFAQQSSGKLTPITIDEQILSFVQSQLPIVTKSISEAKKREVRSLIEAINSVCGNFDTNVYLLSSAKCSMIDSNGNLVTFEMSCQDGTCNFTKKIQKHITIKVSGQQNVGIQATPNVPSPKSTSIGKWIKISAAIMYVILTIYLFMVAASNLFKREIIFLVIDLLLWAAITATMYMVMGGF